MLKKLINNCTIDLLLEPLDPILIKSGQATVHGPDMAFVETFRKGVRQVYFPGTSLKGVIRSHVERIARTLKPGSVCNPFAKNGPDVFCGVKLGKQDSAEKTYNKSCLACKMFGSTRYAGRVSISDAYPYECSPRPQMRDGVGIDRFTGGAFGGAKFNLEVVADGTFNTTISMVNFELWQLGLLAYVFKDMEDGLLSVGYGRSRGLGRFTASVLKADISYLSREPLPDGEIWGVGMALGENDYGIVPEDRVRLDTVVDGQRRGLRYNYSFSNGNLTEMFTKVSTAFNKYLI